MLLPVRKTCLNILQNTSQQVHFSHYRLLHSTRCLSCSKNPEKKKASEVALWKRPYLYTKNAVYRGIDRYESWWFRKHPKSFKIYLLFKEGMRDLFRDSRSCINVATQVNYHKVPLDRFSRYELDNYRQLPQDLKLIGPIVVLLNIPILDTILPPVLYFFPRQLLCRHFWTPEQRIEFGTFKLQKRIHTYPKIFYFMQKEAARIKDEGQKKVFNDILQQLEKGEQADIEAILDCKDVFTGKPLGLDRLYRSHRIHVQWHIAHSLGFPGRKSKLVASTNLLWHIDKAMYKEGIDALSLEDMRLACMTRGLSVVDLPQEELAKYLTRWTTISNAVTPDCFSLLLHSPVLLGYSHPGNQKYLIEAVDVTEGVIRP